MRASSRRALELRWTVTTAFDSAGRRSQTTYPSHGLHHAGAELTYAWDDLGRLTAITPAGAEVPTVIEYVSAKRTVVRRTLGRDQP